MTIQQVIDWLYAFYNYNTMDRTQRLFQEATKFLGRDASPENLASSEVACAETVTYLISLVDPKIQWSNRLATYYVEKDMLYGRNFRLTDSPRPGTIVISATKWDKNAKIVVGHIGVVMKDGRIASNNSFGKHKGKFEENYSLESWRRYFVDKKGLDMLIFSFT